MHTYAHQHVWSSMARLPHHSVTISACLAGALLLLPFCWGIKDDVYEYDYDSTQNPEDHYNSSIEISIFSNASTDELERFLFGEPDTGSDPSITETETDGSVLEEKPTEPSIFIMSQASRSTPLCFLLTLVLMFHHLLRLQ